MPITRAIQAANRAKLRAVAAVAASALQTATPFFTTRATNLELLELAQMRRVHRQVLAAEQACGAGPTCTTWSALPTKGA